MVPVNFRYFQKEEEHPIGDLSVLEDPNNEDKLITQFEFLT
jgi:hypothetical protein